MIITIPAKTKNFLGPRLSSNLPSNGDVIAPNNPPREKTKDVTVAPVLNPFYKAK